MNIFLLLMIISFPGAPSVRYTALIYPSEAECLTARDGYMNAYESKDLIYKSNMKTEAFCLPFESFPIAGIIKKTDA
jgi:hypothetical protein